MVLLDDSVLSLFVGAISGGLLLVRALIYAPTLPFVITVAVVVTAAIFLQTCGAAEHRKNQTEN
jgi:uncharacterized membrane protein YoaK (UPF0700 family)